MIDLNHKLLVPVQESSHLPAPVEIAGGEELDRAIRPVLVSSPDPAETHTTDSGSRRVPGRVTALPGVQMETAVPLVDLQPQLAEVGALEAACGPLAPGVNLTGLQVTLLQGNIGLVTAEQGLHLCNLLGSGEVLLDDELIRLGVFDGEGKRVAAGRDGSGSGSSECL